MNVKVIKFGFIKAFKSPSVCLLETRSMLKLQTQSIQLIKMKNGRLKPKFIKKQHIFHVFSTTSIQLQHRH